MQSEKQVVETFKKLFKGNTLTELSELTNIQRTRLFRLLNGAELKLKEAQKMNRLIFNKVGGDYSRSFYESMSANLFFGKNKNDNSSQKKHKRELAYLYFLTREEN